MESFEKDRLDVNEKQALSQKRKSSWKQEVLRQNRLYGKTTTQASFERMPPKKRQTQKNQPQKGGFESLKPLRRRS